MKKIYSHTLIILSIISLIVFSCGDMDSIHEDYLQGEQVYAGKLDTLKIRPGYYRAQLEGQTQFLGNSTKIIIEYDDELEIYDIISEDIRFAGESVLDLPPEKRAHLGLFLSFQYPVEIPGVTVSNFIRTALNRYNGD